jgi:hypothetical protein
VVLLSAAPPPIPTPSPVHSKPGNGRVRSLRILALLLVLSGFVFAVIIPLRAAKYIGRVKLEVNPPTAAVVGKWKETEFKIITASATLQAVVEKLALDREWNLSASAALERLSGMVEVQEERDSDLLVIEIYSPDPSEASRLANAVADAYEERKKAQEKAKTATALAPHQAELEAQERRLDEKRAKMLAVMKKYDLKDPASFPNLSSEWRGEAGKPAANSDPLSAGKDGAARAYLDNLLAEDGLARRIRQTEDRLQNAASEDLLDSADASDLGSKYVEANQRLDSLLRSGLDARHPKVQAARAELDDLKQLLIAEAKQKLEASLSKDRRNLEDVRKSLINEPEHSPEEAKAEEYLHAKHDYEDVFREVGDLRERKLKEMVDLMIPPQIVRSRENAFPASVPARLSKISLFGTAGGFVLLSLLVLILSCFAKPA